MANAVRLAERPNSRPFRCVARTASSRTATEDRLAVRWTDSGVVLAVADGAGGMAGGGEAADLFCRIVEDAASSPELACFTAESAFELLRTADQRIDEDRRAGETTGVVIHLRRDGSLAGATAGDSGALVIGRGGSVDDLGAKQRPYRSRRLGSGRAVPTRFERPALAGTLLVATDGLLSFARPEQIARILSEHTHVGDAADALVAAVRLPNGQLRDDVALLLVTESP